MANILRPRKASSNPSYEGFDLGHSVYFTSSVGHILPIHWDMLIPGDKVSLKTHMVSRMLPMNSASPITLREHVDYYFVPLECLYSLFPSLLSDTNEDAVSSLFDVSTFKDGIPVANIQGVKNSLSIITSGPSYLDDYGFDSRLRGASRLIEFFKYGHIPPLQSSDLPSDIVTINMLLAQAYQAVWQYYFRDDKRRQFDATYFNVDSCYQSLAISDTLGNKFLSLQYRPWKKDPYTLISPSPLGGASSFNHFSNTSSQNQFTSFVQQWLTKIGGNAIIPEVVGSDGQNPNNNTNYTDVGFSNRSESYAVQQSLQQHRIAQAIEKLSAIWMQSGKNYKDMMSNLFGVAVKEDWSKPMYIGSDTNTITIDEEVANVGTDKTDAGEITGRGYGRSQGQGVKFEAKRHGILLALYSCVPDAVYAGEAIDMFNTYSKRNSFPFPQTDELGEQPLFGFEIDDVSGIDTSIIKGWAPRFHELKLKENRAYGAFRDSLAIWIPFRDYQAYYAVDWLNFYINPDYLNPIMLQGYSSAWPSDPNSDRFANDPLMHFFYVEETKGSKMSSYGVPKTYFG